MGKPALRRWATVAAVVLLLLPLAIIFPAIPTSAISAVLPAREGRVLLQPENQPIAGATVKATCQVIDPNLFFSIHGSSGTRDLPDIITTSDEFGRYTFDALALSKCWGIIVSAEKPGYETTARVLWRSPLNPERGQDRNGSDVWMMTSEAILDRHLRSLVLRSEPYPGDSVAAQFHRVFSEFSCSMRIAETPRQLAFVRDNFCERARDLVKRLPPTERSATGLNRNMTYQCTWANRLLESVPVTTEAVETYCQTQ